MQERICPFINTKDEEHEYIDGFPSEDHFPKDCPFKTLVFGTGFPEGCPYRDDTFGMGFPEGCPIRYARMKAGFSPFAAYKVRLEKIKAIAENSINEDINKKPPYISDGLLTSSTSKSENSSTPYAIDPFNNSCISEKKKDKSSNNTKSKSSINEFFTGKYIMGIVGALLLLGAAVSFLSVYWENIPDIIKILIIALTGFLISLGGSIRIIKHGSNPFISAVTGTGGGLIGVSLMCAYFAFNLISLPVLLVLTSLWALCMIGSYYFLKQFYMVAIAYYGSCIIISIAFGKDVTMSAFGSVTLLMLVIGFIMYFLSKKLMTEKEQILCSYMNVITCVILILFSEVLQYEPEYLISQALLILGIIFAVNSALSKDKSSVRSVIAFIFASISSSIAVFNSTELIIPNYYHYFAISLVAVVLFLMMRTSDKNSFISLKIFLTASIFISLISITYLSMTIMPIGISLFLALSLIGFRDISSRGKILRIMAIIDSILVILCSSMLTYMSDLLPYSLLSFIPAIILIFFIFDDSHESRLSFMAVTMAVISFVSSKIYSISSCTLNMESSSFDSCVITFTSLVFIFCFLLRAGLFADWNGDKMFLIKKLPLFFSKNSFERVIPEYNTFCTLFMYVLGIESIYIIYMLYIFNPDTIIYSFVTISGICLFIFMLLFMIEKNPKHYWIGGILFYIFLWALIDDLFSGYIISFISSAAGLCIAVISIFLGFLRSKKPVRCFGMYLSMAMILKCLLSDVFFVLGTVSAEIVSLSLFVAGVCCFAITKLYTYFEKKQEISS